MPDEVSRDVMEEFYENYRAMFPDDPEHGPVPNMVRAVENGTLTVELVAAWFRHPFVSHSRLTLAGAEFLLAELAKKTSSEVGQ